MPDFMDAVQDRVLLDIEIRLAERTRPSRVGRTHCEAMDCGAAIAPARQALGAQLCFDCQTDAEARAKHRREAR